jgi:expansin (peptidoglycan-binding protein)
MKKALILFVFLFGLRMMAQDQSTITVKSTQSSGDVVVVNAIDTAVTDHAKAGVELHCNKDAGSCKAPVVGSYLMVRLPKNWGMYDCQNVDLYPAGADPATSQKIGEYCLSEK